MTRRNQIAIALLLCAAAPACNKSTAANTSHAGKPDAQALNIKLATVYVDDQDKALHFYTDVLGFVKKDDVSKGPYRWLTVASQNGMELQLASSDNPAAKTYQQAIFQQGQPAAMFFTDDVQGAFERIKARGAEFKMEPTAVTGSRIAQLNDTCGNLIQITQLIRP